MSANQEIANRRETLYGMAAMSVISAVLLVLAATGRHAYDFYGWLRLVVAATSAYVLYTFWRFLPRMIFLGFLVGAFGAFIFFGRLQRQQWIPYDWAGALLFSCCALLALVGTRVKDTET